MIVEHLGTNMNEDFPKGQVCRWVAGFACRYSWYRFRAKGGSYPMVVQFLDHNGRKRNIKAKVHYFCRPKDLKTIHGRRYWQPGAPWVRYAQVIIRVPPQWKPVKVIRLATLKLDSSKPGGIGTKAVFGARKYTTLKAMIKACEGMMTL